ncbi:helix-turn-helix transcriptional regulator [Actinocrinis puniceicyclus]|uniref:Helix-turn-helix transcriptional regulator n=1 Tax=Actinocrinis puniceicyclus TaxID=977794 RepID=A0A8J7WS08_9ACTN|nr:helix-turn-helix domain-containing protein [Actinocrinis puniceicyclus]MBS2965382.1 helix-turn-helix transcriptional regulator [Actinocrinis puniceicyclus]
MPITQDSSTAVAPGSGADSSVALRALAHPLRWKILDLLRSEESATATRCARAFGESVASCSYHLAILAKYGFVERVPDHPSRERPWRLSRLEQRLDTPPGGEDGDAADAPGAESVVEVFLEHEFTRLRGRMRARHNEPEQWRPMALGETTFLTGEEFDRMRQELRAIVVRYQERGAQPGTRPVGSREARLFVAVSAAPSVGADR